MQHMYVKWWNFNPLKTITMPHNAMSGRMRSACHMRQKEQRGKTIAMPHNAISSSPHQRFKVNTSNSNTLSELAGLHPT
jgi:hypothetical protein